MFSTSTLKFLKDLKKNNDKSWFDANRKVYESARGEFEQFIGELIVKYSKKDVTISHLKPKECMFRMNRDVRFSKDKSPYKTNFGASINRGGKKSNLAGYYFHLEPGAAFAGGGVWMPMPSEMQKIRQEIDYAFDEFKKIIRLAKFQKTYGDLYRGEDATLVKVPKGYEKDNPAAEYLKLKSWLGMRPLTDKELQSKELLPLSLDSFSALQPMLDFLNRALV